MTVKYAKHVSTKTTPQSQPVLGKNQVKNNAGGFVFEIDKWARLERFLVLGSEGGTYYASESKLTKENAKCILDCANEDARRTVNTICDFSEGRAPKNDPAIFALAMLAGHNKLEVRQLALNNLNRVCRIGTHLFQFAEAVEHFRGWGHGLRKAVANWYTSKSADKLAYQVTKYQQREGWSHRDLLRLSHPSSNDSQLTEVIKYAAKKPCEYIGILQGVEEVKQAKNVGDVVRLIEQYNLVREHIPTQWLNSIPVWEYLLRDMPLGAMVRNLGKMTSLGVLKPMNGSTMSVISDLTNAEKLQKSMLHPLSILTALKTYSQGRGIKGSLSWSPINQIRDALNDAFYESFGNIIPANRRTLIGLDVSGSMRWGNIAGSPLNPGEASAAMSMVIAKTEPAYQVMGFADTFRDLGITKNQSLEQVIEKTGKMAFGRTDCALPMIYAMQNKIEVDTFMILTDNDTWCGSIHPYQALNQYRQTMGIPAKLVVVGMTATNFSIADPSDAGMMDVVGFDLAVPNIIADFSRS